MAWNWASVTSWAPVEPGERQGWHPLSRVSAEADPAAPFWRGEPGAAPTPCALPMEGGPVWRKPGASACAGTGLAALLRRGAIGRLVIAGAVAAFCGTATTRSASEPGFAVIRSGDVRIGFDKATPDGGRIAAEGVLRVTLSLPGVDLDRLVSPDQGGGLL